MVLPKEEKKAKLGAQKLEMEEEREATKQQKKDELLREMKTHSLMRKNLEQKWFETMTRIQEPKHLKNIEAMRQTFNRALDKKDHQIDLLMHLQDVAADQHQRMVSSYSITVDSIINNFSMDLEMLWKQNDTNTAQFLKEGKDEVNSILEESKIAEIYLQMLLYNEHNAADSLEWTVRGENMVKKYEEDQIFFKIFDDLFFFLENNCFTMWGKYRTALKDYVAHTFENQKLVRKFRRKHNEMANIIASQAKTMVTNEAAIRRLRLELASYESGSKQKMFRARHSRYRDACNDLKISFHEEIDTDVKQLTILVAASDDSIDWLKNAQQKSEQILRVAALCRKFETQREKIMPNGTTIFPTSTLVKVSAHQKHSAISMVVNAISLTCPLARLWNRISEAELSKRALYREKIKLKHENADLMHLLEVEKERCENKQKVTPATFKCRPVKKIFQKSFLDQPHAVDASLKKRKLSTKL